MNILYTMVFHNLGRSIHNILFTQFLITFGWITCYLFSRFYID